MRSFESIDNHRLIYNGLEHIEFELCRQPASYFRIAREAHQILYRSLVGALKGTANIAVTGKPKGRREHRYQLGNGPIKEIHKESVAGCNFAWRFSDPVVVDSFFQSDVNETSTRSDDFLIPFYDALAMIQTECFVHQFVQSQEVTITDQEMKLMEWLHEAIRNEYEHFVPRGYSAPIENLLLTSKVALEKALASLFHTKNVLFFDHSVPQKLMRDKFDNILRLTDSHLNVGGKATEHSQ
jgi:hypothetical protein